MCGIFVAYQTEHAGQEVYKGLKRLEYRGYDSWGVVSPGKNSLVFEKRTGILGDLSHFAKDKTAGPWLNANISVGHTRWATHGGITKTNAHPHLATDGSFALVQNGIVENHQLLKNELLAKKYKFKSQTDTEVIVRLIEDKLKSTKSGVLEAVRQVFLELEGRNTIAILEKSGRVVAIRNGSPLVIGRTKSGTKYTYYLSSDELSLAPVAKEIMVLDNQQMVVLEKGELKVGTINKIWGSAGSQTTLRFRKIQLMEQDEGKGGFDHFMIKEIFQTPMVIKKVNEIDGAKLSTLAKAVSKARYVFTIGSGTAGLAAAQMAYYLKVHAGVMAIGIVGAEGMAYQGLWSDRDIIIAPSQSGETADVLEVLEAAKKADVKIASFVNMPGSMITRMSDFPFMSEAGSERCVMSTKVFSSQITFGYLLAKAVRVAKSEESLRQTEKLLEKAAINLEKYLADSKNHAQLKKIAKKLIKSRNIFLLGKGQSLEIVREGMVKIIEGTYLHAHAIPAGDLKHYAITIMAKGVPVIVALPDDQDKTDVLSAISQVRARGASVLALTEANFAGEIDAEDVVFIPDGMGELAAVGIGVVLQLLAYYMTVALGQNVDKPRNIAKSVTVK